jgi:hypothetical protein
LKKHKFTQNTQIDFDLNLTYLIDLFFYLKITFGILSDKVSALNMNAVCLLIIAICKFSYYLLNAPWMQYAFAVLFAIGMGLTFDFYKLLMVFSKIDFKINLN